MKMFQLQSLRCLARDVKISPIIFRGLKQTIDQINPEYDINYLTNPTNYKEIKTNITNRKGVGNIEEVYNLVKQISQTTDASARQKLQNQLNIALKSIPNRTHPDVAIYGNEPKEFESIGAKRNFDFKPKRFEDLCKNLNILRTNELGNFNGSRSYYLMNELAELEEALIRYTLNNLSAKGFQLISVPEILPAEVIEGCGMKTSGERNQIYKILQNNLCLSGTSEMALGGYFAGKVFKEDVLPIKVMAVSRCYRAETSTLYEERGIFRVHSFTKIEMFSVCSPNQSENMIDEFRKIETDLFEKLNLHFMILDMPPCELGASAFRKFDIEAWMPGRGSYGEISSCSNCTDYQSRRLNIRCIDRNENIAHVHTVNGTGCAIPRMLIAIVENFQNNDGTVDIPAELQTFMNDKTKIQRTKLLPELKLMKKISLN